MAYTHVASTIIVLAIVQLHSEGFLEASQLPEPVGFWKFSDELHGTDLSGYRNHAILSSVTLVDGPNGEKSAYKLAGTFNSYIRIPNNGALNAESYTVVMQIIPGTRVGPTFQWIWDDAWSHSATHVWMSPSDFYLRLVDRTNPGNIDLHLVQNNVFISDAWVFAAVTYDFSTGETKLWKDSELVISTTFPNISQRSYNDVMIGVPVNSGDSRYWDGKVSCYQFYDKALDELELLEVQNLCRNYGLKDKKRSWFTKVGLGGGLGLAPVYVKTINPSRSCIICASLCLHDVKCHLFNFVADENLCEMSDYKYESLNETAFITRGIGCTLYKRLLI